ncbi:S-adenosyl-L-methionine-dependent methyltransferase [Rhodofomes roseus]|uniref:S-adenosyl-L-methionine-dependent methyltransferase n=1 Tax=Rhodofomes roseus TaxID=34475 RepID=A0ABQ8JYC8_9APHY|nr:S-adenosyl-L-methionine-dependent methyltransferase [Rhodofomes roseus]KAH9829165.1 S-adenosyl-L-methionine-dependent methyltransferase [Rhodofomes roseus]
MPTSKSNRAQTLRSLVQLLVNTSEVVIKEWEAEEQHPQPDDHLASSLPSHQLFEARRIIVAACGMCVDLVEDPRIRLQELSETFALSQAFDTTVRAGVPDILAEAMPRSGSVSAAELSQRTGIDEKKLVRLMRFLCSGGLYEEVKYLDFANTRMSGALAGNPPAQAFQLIYGTKAVIEPLAYLPETLLDPKMTSATSATESAFQKAFKTKQTLWDFVEGGDDSDEVVREIRQLFPLSMAGQTQLSSRSIVADFPWGSLGEATIVDVGGGVGSMCTELAKVFPNLQFVVQDLAAAIEQAKSYWKAEDPKALGTGRVELMVHDFFKEQPVKGAAVYLLRCVLHDWPDDDCVKILTRLREAMAPDSRILIAEMIIHPPLGSTQLKSAPAPLPANYGRASLMKGMHDIVMLSSLNGSERTPEQFVDIASRAGLRTEKIWECRSPVSITELRL